MQDIISNELKDPRVPLLTSVTQVKMTRDLSHATVFVSVYGSDSEKNIKLMNDLKEKGSYEASADMKKFIDESFTGGFASEEMVSKRIKNVYDKTGYVIDTHTAVAATVYDKYKKATGDNKTTVIASTASPFKFTRSVMNAIDKKYDQYDDFTLIDELSKLANVKIPQAIEDIRTAPVIHDHVCEISEMPDVVR